MKGVARRELLKGAALLLGGGLPAATISRAFATSEEFSLSFDPEAGFVIDPDGGPLLTDYVYLRLYEADNGAPDASGRSQRPEFASRKPGCIRNFDATGTDLEIVNTGSVITELVLIEHQVIFCTLASHGPMEGFDTDHAGEFASMQQDAFASVDTIPPRGSVLKRIQFPEWNGQQLANIYFRARVSTLWSPDMPVEQWDFAADPTVTEYHLRVA
ncbi:MAG: hypothetical protein AB7O56_02565 [Bauldia sp.]